MGNCTSVRLHYARSGCKASGGVQKFEPQESLKELSPGVPITKLKIPLNEYSLDVGIGFDQAVIPTLTESDVSSAIATASAPVQVHTSWEHPQAAAEKD